MAVLFKDVTTSGVHAPTALGNQGKKRGATMFSGIKKPPISDDLKIDVDKRFIYADAQFDGRRIAAAVMSKMAAPYAAPKVVEKFAQVLKVDEGLGLVFGWAIICKVDGADHYDLQDDHIPEESMLAAAADFMASGAMAKEMHAGEAAGAVLFAFPLTGDIAKAFGLETKQTGLMVAMKPNDRAMLGKFKDGTYSGFSIGGVRLKDEAA